MRKLLVLTLIVGLPFSSALSGCHAEKKLPNSNVNQSNEDANELGSDNATFTYGKVSTAYENDGCAYLIYLDTPIENGMEFLLPIGLSDVYLKHDLRIKFEWSPSRAPSGNCYKGKPAILSNIRAL